MPTKSIRAAHVVENILLDSFSLDSAAEELRFRIVVLRWSPAEFTCQLWRRETYKLVPSHPGTGTQAYDMEIEVLDEGVDWASIRGASSHEVRETMIAKLETFFGLTIGRP